MGRKRTWWKSLFQINEKMPTSKVEPGAFTYKVNTLKVKLSRPTNQKCRPLVGINNLIDLISISIDLVSQCSKFDFKSGHFFHSVRKMIFNTSFA